MKMMKNLKENSRVHARRIIFALSVLWYVKPLCKIHWVLASQRTHARSFPKTDTQRCFVLCFESQSRLN